MVDANGSPVCSSFNKDSPYYSYFVSDATSPYPSVLCSDACGPFVNFASPFDALKQLCNQNSVMSVMFSILFTYTYFPWIVALFLVIYIVTRDNSLSVVISTYRQIEKVLKSKLDSLKAENTKQKKIIKRFQIIEITNNDYKIN